MAFKTRITEMLGIEHPVVQGGMQWVGTAEMASAVSNAGGLGILTALTQPTPAALAAEIARCRTMTAKPFGVNITVFPTINAPDYKAYAQAALDGGIRIFETAGTPAVREIWEMIRPHGVKILHKCTAVRHALSSEKAGVDVISIDGFECAGHPGEDDIGLIVLLPATVDAVDVPVIASGGMADGRSLVAALALGADGVNMGTRFCATVEAKIHENVKRQIVEFNERDTVLVGRTLRNTARVARNAVSEKVVEIQQDPTKTFDDVREYMAGVRGRENVLRDGDMDGGIWTTGQSQALIHDIPTCAELVGNIMGQANSIIRERLAGIAA